MSPAGAAPRGARTAETVIAAGISRREMSPRLRQPVLSSRVFGEARSTADMAFEGSARSAQPKALRTE